MNHNFFIYIVTNFNKMVLYIGVTNDLKRRLYEHENGLSEGFTKKYKCFYLVYYECFTNINQAIEREKQLKGWKREKKVNLINELNPNWNFLNKEIKEE
ncbi:MAG TPA: endonuclease [Bacteroidales bacterium]|nr:MAG: endonuclease [Bacteroidetes bacterium GWF2_33_38]OFY76516.1 MAG: endonuclease [Bacteroidetes bacterium RIFOXYA12_FULL_33_9]HBF89267.1 endonuclease [Bacteroidales bacterium]